MSLTHSDVIIIGGGLSGLVTARELSAEGKSVVLLEARSRLGGRVYYGTFAETEERVEWGGGWVAPEYQPLIAAEIERYGLRLSVGEPGLEQRTVLDGATLYGGLPIPPEDISELERAVWQCTSDSRRIEYGIPWEEQNLEDIDVAWTQYVDRMNLPAAVHEYLLTWTTASDPATTSALNILVLFATFGNSAWAAYNSMQLKFQDGTAALVDAIAKDAGAEIHFDAVVTHVEQSNGGVSVTTADGRSFSGATAVLTTPVNTWTDVQFTPPLSESKQAAAQARHVGTGQKIWMKIKDTATGGVTGWGFGKGINILIRDRTLGDEGDLYIGFTGGNNPDINDRTELQQAVQVFAPGAKVTSAQEHNWLTDPYAQGVWAVYQPGHFTQHHTELSKTEGRLYFAGSDISFGQQLWMEGAFETAFEVTKQILESQLSLAKS